MHAHSRMLLLAHTLTHHTHTHALQIHALLVMKKNEKKMTDHYAEEKRWVFSFDLKEESEDDCLMEAKREEESSRSQAMPDDHGCWCSGKGSQVKAVQCCNCVNCIPGCVQAWLNYILFMKVLAAECQAQAVAEKSRVITAHHVRAVRKVLLQCSMCVCVCVCVCMRACVCVCVCVMIFM